MSSRKTAAADLDASDRKTRGSLSREQILLAARKLLETNGLQNLTFPRLAAHLNASATSLYYYFAGKEELLTAVFVDVTAELYARLPPINGGPWDVEMFAQCQNFRTLVQQTPVYREVFGYQTQTLFQSSRMLPYLITRVEEDLNLLVRAGLTADDAATVFNAISSFTRAFILVEQTRPEQVDRRAHQLNRVILDEVASELPILSTIDDLAITQDLGDELFSLGLMSLILGLCRSYPILESTRGMNQPLPVERKT